MVQVARVCLSSAALVASCGGSTSHVLLLGGLLEVSSSALMVLVSMLGLFCRVFLPMISQIIYGLALIATPMPPTVFQGPRTAHRPK